MRESMDFLTPFIVGNPKPNGVMKQLDWDEAEQIIESRKHQGLVSVEAGLVSDWDCTSGEVWRNGSYVPQNQTYTFTASTWAIPAIILTFEDGHEEEIPVWKHGDDAHGYFHPGVFQTKEDNE